MFLFIFAEKYYKMNYLEYQIDFQPFEEYIADLLASYLAEIGFESFEATESGMLAYVDETCFDKDLFEQLIKNFPYAERIEVKENLIQQVNWNEEWEKNFFEPIIIGNECVIHSSFHKDIPECRYKIIIDPKMSFGTGHHETTSLMIQQILKMDLTGKSVLDMGCGTAVLAILAAIRGAGPVTAIDIDPWCVENSIENIDKNECSHIDLQLGTAENLGDQYFDVILANINRNILLNDIPQYEAVLNPGGLLLLSGFYTEDIPSINEKLNENSIQMIEYQEKNNWVTIISQHIR
jgi:ribosomal protein L11 methyltransferase